MRRSLRGCIITKWKASGNSLSVRYDQVLNWAKDCDESLLKDGLNPSPKFRQAREGDDEEYMKAWLKGCRFRFRIVDDSITSDMRKLTLSKDVIMPNDMWRACLKCGRLNLATAVYCSYCRKNMPRDTE